MKIITILTSVFIMAMNSCHSDTGNCANFKEGEFVFYSKEENKYDSNLKTIRTKNKQMYFSRYQGDTLTYEINWKSDCQYELTLIESNRELKPHMVQIGDKLIVDIEPIDKTSFKYRSKRMNSEIDREFTGKMKKIK